MTETTPVPCAVQEIVDAHVDDVDEVLKGSGVERAERRTICDELECQITDILSQRFSAVPTIADVKALLAEMDPPSSFSQQIENRPPDLVTEPTVQPLAIGAAVTAILGIVVAFIYAEWRGAESDRQQAAIIVLLITFLALAMGVTAIREIRRYARTKRGYLLAYIGVISLPICFSLWANREISYPINTRLSREVAEYTRSQRMIVKTADGEIAALDSDERVKAGDTVLSPAGPRVELPFVPWITTKRDVRLFSITACFGPTLLLTLILVPFFYRRFHPRRVRA